MPLGRGLASLIPPPEERENKPQQYREEETAPDITPHEEQNLSTEAPPVIEPQTNVSVPSVYINAKPEEKVEDAVFQIEVDKIFPNPHQPRKYFDEDALRELALSIREFGILQPLVISKVESESETGWTVRYELVTGERRLMAAKIAGLHTVPAIIRKEPDDREKLEIAVIENIQREDLNPIEFARAVARLQDEFGLTQREIAVRIGKSRETIANAVRLLGLPTEIQNAVAEGKLSESHARLLLSVDDAALRFEVFEDILKYSLNVRETDLRIKRGRGGVATEDAIVQINPEIETLKYKLEEFLGTKIGLQSKGASGKITINFYSPQELEAIVDKVIKQNDNQSPLPPSES